MTSAIDERCSSLIDALRSRFRCHEFTLVPLELNASELVTNASRDTLRSGSSLADPFGLRNSVRCSIVLAIWRELHLNEPLTTAEIGSLRRASADVFSESEESGLRAAIMAALDGIAPSDAITELLSRPLSQVYAAHGYPACLSRVNAALRLFAGS